MQPAKVIHPPYEVIQLGGNLLKCFLFKTDDFHNFTLYFVNTIFVLYHQGKVGLLSLHKTFDKWKRVAQLSCDTGLSYGFRCKLKD